MELAQAGIAYGRVLHKGMVFSLRRLECFCLLASNQEQAWDERQVTALCAQETKCLLRKVSVFTQQMLSTCRLQLFRNHTTSMSRQKRDKKKNGTARDSGVSKADRKSKKPKVPLKYIAVRAEIAK